MVNSRSSRRAGSQSEALDDPPHRRHNVPIYSFDTYLNNYFHRWRSTQPTHHPDTAHRVKKQDNQVSRYTSGADKNRIHTPVAVKWLESQKHSLQSIAGIQLDAARLDITDNATSHHTATLQDNCHAHKVSHVNRGKSKVWRRNKNHDAGKKETTKKANNHVQDATLIT